MASCRRRRPALTTRTDGRMVNGRKGREKADGRLNERMNAKWGVRMSLPNSRFLKEYCNESLRTSRGSVTHQEARNLIMVQPAVVIQSERARFRTMDATISVVEVQRPCK